MSTEETRQDTYGARHWASAYMAYIAGLVLTACSYLTNAFGLHEHGLTAGVLLGVPLVTRPAETYQYCPDGAHSGDGGALRPTRTHPVVLRLS